MEDLIFNEAEQNLERMKSPAVLLLNSTGEPAEPSPLMFEAGLRARASARGWFVLRFTEPMGTVYQHNWMLSRVPELPFEELVACRAGEWDKTFGEKG